MSRYRGAAVFVATLFTLIALGLAFYILVPRREIQGVETHVLDGMVATVQGLLGRCGLPGLGSLAVLQGPPWNWLAGAGAIVLVLTFLYLGGSRS